MTPEQKAKEYLKEYSKEKAIDVATTMKWYAKEMQEKQWVDFWKRVIQILKAQSPHIKRAMKCRCKTGYYCSLHQRYS